MNDRVPFVRYWILKYLGIEPGENYIHFFFIDALPIAF